MPTKIHPKLAAKNYGPYLLKKAAGHHLVEPELPTELQGTTEIYQPFQILGTRTVNLSGIEVPQVLVHWQGKLPEEATWKDTFSIGVNLEDKEARQAAEKAYDMAKVDEGVNRAVAASNRAANAARVAAVKAVQKQNYHVNSESFSIPVV
ncbi:hypothetical protein D0Y65_000982 [Glycine soja]|uniref:Chromo domain-containing protein n=1 Tax=Glycine soja TaxID=3848 RepID=A0A445M133_GLYSO|nr:hypothetical protein D0Y65_000982 [Glycine soja]